MHHNRLVGAATFFKARNNFHYVCTSNLWLHRLIGEVNATRSMTSNRVTIEVVLEFIQLQ